MGKIVVTGWKPGFRKVQTNKMLRQRFGYALDVAKYAVEDILERRPVHLAVSNEEMEMVCKELDSLGALYEVQDGECGFSSEGS